MIDRQLVEVFNKCVCYKVQQESRLINENNLLSALSVQQWFETNEVKAAAIFRSIIQGHPFQDGNKRTAVLLIMYMCEPTCSEDTLFDTTIKVAEGRLKDPEEIANILYP